MPTIRRAAQVVPGGGLITNQADIASIWKHDGDTLLGTASSDAQGFWSFTYTPEGSDTTEWILNPGPIYWTVAYLGNALKGSSKAAGMVGSNSMLEFPEIIQIMGDGVVSGAITGDFAPTYDGAGRDVDIAAGYASVKGVGVISTSSRKVTLGVADGANPRIDTVVLELTRTTGDTEGKVVLKVIAGTPAASPVAPTLTQNANTWQYPLADARINAGQVNLASVTDRRTFPGSTSVKNPTVMVETRSSAAGTLDTTEASIVALQASPTLLNNVVYDIMCDVVLYVDGAASVGMIAPFIDGTTNAADYQTAPAQGGVVTLTNAHVKTVIGTGISITCGVLAKRSGTANVVNHYGGLTSVRAIPRT